MAIQSEAMTTPMMFTIESLWAGRCSERHARRQPKCFLFTRLFSRVFGVLIFFSFDFVSYKDLIVEFCAVFNNYKYLSNIKMTPAEAKPEKDVQVEDQG